LDQHKLSGTTIRADQFAAALGGAPAESFEQIIEE
jgi:hypothetical protein